MASVYTEKNAGTPTVKLNDGRYIPIIAMGTWKIPTDVCTDQVDQAIEIGFEHIDTAQAYRNETETGLAIRESGLERDAVWVTTKWSGLDGKGPKQSIDESLEKLGLKYVDLLLIHHPRLCNGDIPAAWAEMEKIQKAGLAKSIGVSNFSVDDLKVLLKHAKVKPVVNQILFHPYVWHETKALVEFQKEHDIWAEAYSGLIPLTTYPGGAVDKPVNRIAEKYQIAPEQVLLAWVIAHGGIPITTSSKLERLQRYLKVPFLKLTEDEVAAIDHAGRKGARTMTLKKAAKKFAVGALVSIVLSSAISKLLL